MAIIIKPAQADDGEELLRFLRDRQLPVDGLTDHLATVLIAKDQGVIVGSAGLEIYRDSALLRSVAVADRLQGHGLGHQITNAALQLAGTMGVTAVYLLTTTAEQFFPKFGFERIDRTDVPSAVRTSIEFTSACPSSATVMRKIL